ncbi:MAG: cobalamin biosynthesis protein CbiX [Clostridia bacterium]|nr:cobalamin biosynthesis protein CbiX [Clostridia bacterium]
MKRGIVILGHGSRARVWEANQLLLQIVEKFKKKTGAENVKPAYMNVKSGGPTLEQAIEELIREGFTEIVVAPWFLTDGLHIREDIPEIIDSIKEKYPEVQIALAKPLGADNRLVDILIERIGEVS